MLTNLQQRMQLTTSSIIASGSSLCCDICSNISRVLAEYHRKTRPISGLIYAFTVSVTFGVLYPIFIYFILIRGTVQVQGTTFDASTTNLLVSIFSQIFAILIDTTLRELLGALRLNFAAEARGTSALTWFGIGPSSQWISTAKFTMASRLMNIWCLLRLGLPFLSLAFGSVLKLQSNFEYYFVAGDVQIPVYAGLTPLDNRVLSVVPTADLCQYFTTWTSSLQSNARYATGTSFHGCGEGCRALLWPGGLETVRQISDGIPYLNQSIYHGGYFDNVSVAMVNNAPGIITTFERLDSEFFFDVVQDCVLGGQFNNDGIKICTRQVDQSMAVGWASCPQEVFDEGSCDTNTTWQQAPMKWKTLMTAYKQFTTTAYNRRNLSIIDTRLTSIPQSMLLNATEYSDIIKAILVPSNTSTSASNTSIAALEYALTWVHRTYGGTFPDDEGTLITTLQNFFTIPLQFTVTAKQFANYTVESKGLEPLLGDFPLPDDMITTATGGSSSQRLAIQSWTGWTFIAADAAALIFVLVCIVWMLKQESPLPRSTGVAEIDILVLASTTMAVKVDSPMPLRNRSALEVEGGIFFSELPDRVTTKSSSIPSKELRTWRIKY